MANEATVTASLQISKDSLEYRSLPTSSIEDVATGKGPTPGAFTAAYAGNGTQIDFTNLSTPALAVIRNFDDTNYVELGVVVSATFYSILEIPAEKFYVIRFGQNMTTTIVYIRANTANCEVSVEAFEA